MPVGLSQPHIRNNDICIGTCLVPQRVADADPRQATLVAGTQQTHANVELERPQQAATMRLTQLPVQHPFVGVNAKTIRNGPFPRNHTTIVTSFDKEVWEKPLIGDAYTSSLLGTHMYACSAFNVN